MFVVSRFPAAGAGCAKEGKNREGSRSGGKIKEGTREYSLYFRIYMYIRLDNKHGEGAFVYIRMYIHIHVGLHIQAPGL